MEPESQRIYDRIERLERSYERLGTLVGEHSRRIDALEDLPEALNAIHQAIGRLEAKIEASRQYSTLLQGLIWLVIAGILAAGFEMFGR